MTHLEQQNILKDLGLDERETAVYLSLLEEGPLLPQYLSRRTGIKRSTLYIIFPEMIQKGFLQEITQGKRRLLQAIAPDKLYEDYQKKINEVKTGISGLMSIYKVQGLKPHMEVYEGLEGVKKVFLDILEVGKEVLVYDRIKRYDPVLLDWVVKVFVPSRVRKKIQVRSITAHEEAGIEHMASGKEHLRETRFVPLDKFPFLPGEGWVYGDKIAFVMVEENKPLLGVIISSKQISQNNRILFELAWLGAEKYWDKI